MVYYNPSRNAVVYDRRNNRHIQPGERTSVEPDQALLLTGKIIVLSDASPSVVNQSPEPVRVTAAIQVPESETEPEPEDRPNKMKLLKRRKD